MRAALLAALLLPLAGCVGTEEPSTLASTPAASTPAPGGAEAPDAPAVPAATADASPGASAAGPVPVTTTISWDGALPVRLCLPAGVDTCMGPSPGEADASRMDLDGPGNETRVSLQVTWTAATPLTEKLRATVYAGKACGERCWEGRPASDTVTGPSPLALEADLPGLEEGESYLVWVAQAVFTPSPLYAIVHPEQDFHLEGTLTSVV